LSGGSEEKNEYYTKMAIGGVAALFLIYALLAVPLRSYIQPIVIMSVIPFGFIGAVIGHMIFDVSVNILSVFGIIALSGVVVNDSLILVEFANRERAKGLPFEDAILNAGKKRFRAILLTTLTTFVGLLPLLFETSMQAQFVIPMAISLSFGILFASVITLVLIPCLYLVVETNHQFVSRIFLLLLLIPTSYLLVFLGVFTLFFANIIAGILVLMGLLISAGRVRTYFTEPEGQV
jgi:multidrug efflux pump subunit AcrB